MLKNHPDMKLLRAAHEKTAGPNSTLHTTVRSNADEWRAMPTTALPQMAQGL